MVKMRNNSSTVDTYYKVNKKGIKLFIIALMQEVDQLFKMSLQKIIHISNNNSSKNHLSKINVYSITLIETIKV